MMLLQEIHLRASSGETEVPHVEDAVEDAAVDPASTLIRELLDIQMDMKCFQQDKKQLR